MPEPIVEMRGVTKTFGAFRALDDVSLSVSPQTIHAVVGENGAGKTTLMRILFGALGADSGALRVRGQDRVYRNQGEAGADRIGMVSQHYGVIPELTNLQNLMLGAEPGPLLDLGKARVRADEVAARLGFAFDWSALSSSLSTASAQKLEILKLLWRNSEVLILDEPTSMLSPQDSDALFASLRQLVDQGATVIVVTHRLPEVLDHCDHVTVLRGGKTVADQPVAGVTAAELAELIVGHAVNVPPVRDLGQGETVLSVEGLTVHDDTGHAVLSNVSFELRKGEVTGLAGVDGNGQRELFEALFGVRPVAAGRVTCSGRDITRATTAERIAMGVRIVAEDRHEQAVIEEWSVEDNVVLGHQRGLAAAGALVDRSASHQLAERAVGHFNAKVQSVSQPMSGLSGGNQQRVVVGRALLGEVTVLLAFQPSRGLDVDATSRVYQALKEQKDACALVVSFDLEEILTFCDRILVAHHGQIVEPPSEHARDRTAIGCLMVGA